MARDQGKQGFGTLAIHAGQAPILPPAPRSYRFTPRRLTLRRRRASTRVTNTRARGTRRGQLWKPAWRPWKQAKAGWRSHPAWRPARRSCRR